MSTPASARRVAPLLLATLAACSSAPALRERDPSLTEAEVVEAARTADPSLLPDLVYVVEHRDRFRPQVVVAAIDALGTLRDPAALDSLAALLRAPDAEEEARWHAVGAVAEIGGPRARALLEEVEARDPSELVREEAARRRGGGGG